MSYADIDMGQVIKWREEFARKGHEVLTDFLSPAIPDYERSSVSEKHTTKPVSPSSLAELAEAVYYDAITVAKNKKVASSDNVQRSDVLMNDVHEPKESLENSVNLTQSAYWLVRAIYETIPVGSFTPSLKSDFPYLRIPNVEILEICNLLDQSGEKGNRFFYEPDTKEAIYYSAKALYFASMLVARGAGVPNDNESVAKSNTIAWLLGVDRKEKNYTLPNLDNQTKALYYMQAAHLLLSAAADATKKNNF
jgi:hypothetical protein